MLAQFGNYITRKMKTTDSEEVVKLATNSWKVEYKEIIDKKAFDNFPYQSFQNGRQFILKKEDCNCIVATDETGNIVGFSDAGQSWKSSKEEKEGEIYALYVESNHQRRGIGKQLFEAQVSYIKEMGFSHLIIWTWQQNKKSRSFYEKLGGILSDESDKEFEGKKYPTVQYKWV